MSGGVITLLVFVGIAVLAVFYIIALYNKLVALKNQTEAGWSQIDVQLKRRYDLIPNLVEVVKDYMDYEQETLREVIEARAKAMSAREEGREASIAAEGLLGAALGKLFALAEAYPDLKANQNVSELQEQLTTTENKIAFARQHYNDSVQGLNTAIESFPSNFVANSFNFVKGVFFEIPDSDREPVKVDLR
jgi:LemA protein